MTAASRPPPDLAPGSAFAQPWEVAPGLYRLRLPLPFALDHVNAWLLRDGAGWMVVDTGIAGERTRALWESVFADTLRGAPVTRVLATHFHPDHLGSADWMVGRFGADLLMTRSEWLLARLLHQDATPAQAANNGLFYHQAGLDAAQRAALADRGGGYARGVPGVPARYRRLVDGDRLAIGGRTWQVMVGRGHSPEQACLYCADDRLLIAADQILPGISPNVSVWPAEPEADPLSEFLESLQCFARLPADTLVLPSHGEPFRDPGRRCAELAAHHAERLEATRTACADGPASLAAVTALLFPRALDAHQMLFAIGEALAHLNHLVVRGVLARQTDADGVWRFGPARAAGA